MTPGPHHEQRLFECRSRLAQCVLDLPAHIPRRTTSRSLENCDSILSSRMLRVTDLLLPGVETSVLLACDNLRFPRDMVDVYVKPDTEMNATCLVGRSRATVLLSSLLVDITDTDELAFVIGHELGHYLFPETNVNLQIENLESCMLSRYTEFSMDRIGLVACRKVEKAVSAKLKLLSGLHSRHLRIDTSAFIAQWRESSNSPEFTQRWIGATHPPPGFRAKALIQFSGSDTYRSFSDERGGEPISKVNHSIAGELDRLLDRHVRDIITSQLNKLSGWLFAYIAIRGIKPRLSNLRKGLCLAPNETLQSHLGYVLNLEAGEQRHLVSTERLSKSISECNEIAPLHTKSYLQSVIDEAKELNPLAKELWSLSKVHGIEVILPE